MARHFIGAIPYIVPGILALAGCWWVYHQRKKQARSDHRKAIAIEEEPFLSEDKCLDNETSTSLLSAGSLTPSLLCHTCERLDLSQDVSDLSVMMIEPKTLEDDGEKLETESEDGSSVPACVPLPLIGITEEISNAEQSDGSSFKPPKEMQMPEILLSNTGSVTDCCLGLEKEANNPQAFLSNEVEVVPGHKNSAVSKLENSLESACLEHSREEEMFESMASAVPVCQEKDTQPKGDEFEREKIGGVSLDKEEVEKFEQVAIQIISKVILAATEEMLSSSVSDMSTRICQAATSRSERPLETAYVDSSDQMLAEEAMVTDESIAMKSNAAVLTCLQTEEQDQSVTDSSCSMHGCSSPLPGDTKDCQVKNRVCSEFQEVDQTPLENHGGSLEMLPLVVEDSGCSTYTSEGGTGVENPLQNTMLSVTSGQHSDSLSTSASPDTSAEQSSVPSEKPLPLRLADEDSRGPYSNGTLREDGPDLSQKCSRTAGMSGDHSGGERFENPPTITW